MCKEYIFADEMIALLPNSWLGIHCFKKDLQCCCFLSIDNQHCCRRFSQHTTIDGLQFPREIPISAKSKEYCKARVHKACKLYYNVCKNSFQQNMLGAWLSNVIFCIWWQNQDVKTPGRRIKPIFCCRCQRYQVLTKEVTKCAHTWAEFMMFTATYGTGCNLRQQL